MNLLLDTHAVLWWLSGQPLSAAATAAIGHAGALVCVSAVSIWEAELKAALGKLEMDVDLASEVEAEGFEPLSVTFAHARLAGRLPQLHRDPFDRMLVAQARAEGLTLVTRDQAFSAYDVDILSC